MIDLGIRRWPLHPAPSPGEALTSWVVRLAECYEMQVPQLLRNNLGLDPRVLQDPAAADLDWDPPDELLWALAQRTGTQVADLRLMTIAGWVPWLLDTLEPVEGPEIFGVYVRQESVLLRHARLGFGRNNPDRAVRNNAPRAWRPWVRPRDARTWRLPDRVCLVCAADPRRGIPLAAALPLMLSRPEHRCRLEPAVNVRLDRAMERPTPLRPAPEAVTALDRRTWEGLTIGTVTLADRHVHVGVWFRLLRTLLYELSTSSTNLRLGGMMIVERIWAEVRQTTGVRSSSRRKYETLEDEQQQALLEAAAVALQLAAVGEIHPLGSLAHLVTPPDEPYLYEGDPAARGYRRPERHRPLVPDITDVRPTWTAAGKPKPLDVWEGVHKEVKAFFSEARANRPVALQLLQMFTRSCRTLEDFERERQILIDAGVSPDFLPDARGLGRYDLLPRTDEAAWSGGRRRRLIDGVGLGQSAVDRGD